jgi:hypothetical protein
MNPDNLEMNELAKKLIKDMHDTKHASPIPEAPPKKSYLSKVSIVVPPKTS